MLQYYESYYQLRAQRQCLLRISASEKSKHEVFGIPTRHRDAGAPTMAHHKRFRYAARTCCADAGWRESAAAPDGSPSTYDARPDPRSTL